MLTDPVTDPDRQGFRDAARHAARDRFPLDAVRRQCATPAGYDPDSWAALADMGWAGLGIAEGYGGAGLDLVAQVISLLELGATLAPVPALSAAFCAHAIAVAARPEAAAQWLPSIAAGTHHMALLLGTEARTWGGVGPQTSRAGGPARSALSVSVGDGTPVVSGRVVHCLDAGDAETLLAVAEVAGGYGLFALDAGAPGCSARSVPTIDITRRFADVTFDRSPAIALHAEPLGVGEVDVLVDRLAVLLAAETLGAARECFALTLGYLRLRRQFGRPIGAMQALKHRCAEMAVSLTMAQELLFSAAGAGPGACAAAPLALTRAVEVALRVGEEAIQMHGAIGFTDEAAVGLYYKRALSDAEVLAGPSDARVRLEQILAAQLPAGS